MRRFAAVLAVVVTVVTFACKPAATPDSGILESPPTGAFDAEAFWRGATAYASDNGVPTFFLDWNKTHGTLVQSAPQITVPQFDPYTKTVLIPSIYARQFQAYGAGDKNAVSYKPALPGLQNELFHAWFQGALRDPACQSLLALMDAQAQFVIRRTFRDVLRAIPDARYLSEEAMSETVDALSARFPAPAPSYEEAKSLFKLIPGHTQAGEKWAEPAHVREAAERPMTEELYRATLGVMQQGCGRSA